MGFYKATEESTPVTPAAGQVLLYPDTTANPTYRQRDDAGKDFSLLGVNNFSTTSQAPAATTRTYITGSDLRVPKNKLQIGTCMRWRWNMTKTAAGVATSTIDICVGTAGTTADTARLSFTKPAGVAAVDECICELYAVVRGPLSGSGIITGEFVLITNNTGGAGGHLANLKWNFVQSIQSAAFDVTVADLIVGVCITTGSADAITIQQVQSEMWNI